MPALGAAQGALRSYSPRARRASDPMLLFSGIRLCSAGDSGFGNGSIRSPPSPCRGRRRVFLCFFTAALSFRGLLYFSTHPQKPEKGLFVCVSFGSRGQPALGQPRLPPRTLSRLSFLPSAARAVQRAMLGAESIMTLNYADHQAFGIGLGGESLRS